jgi:hypothetical protein
MPREPQSELLYDWRFTPNQFVLAPSSLKPTNSFFFQLHTCGYNPSVTSSLTRGWVYRLQLLLVLWQRSHSHVRLPRDLWPHFTTVSDSDSPTWRAKSPVFISPRNRVARLYPHALRSLFVAAYDSLAYDAYDGTIRTVRIRLHKGPDANTLLRMWNVCLWAL